MGWRATFAQLREGLKLLNPKLKAKVFNCERVGRKRKTITQENDEAARAKVRKAQARKANAAKAKDKHTRTKAKGRKAQTKVTTLVMKAK